MHYTPGALYGDCPTPLQLRAEVPGFFGGASWSRTNNVYHEGTDLQSAAEHAISTIAPKPYGVGDRI